MDQLISQALLELKEKRSNRPLCLYSPPAERHVAGSVLLVLSLTILTVQVVRFAFSCFKGEVVAVTLYGISVEPHSDLLTFFLQLSITTFVWWRYKQRFEAYLATAIPRTGDRQYESPLDIFIGIIGVMISFVVGYIDYWFAFFALISALAGLEYLMGAARLIRWDSAQLRERLFRALNVVAMRRKAAMGFLLAGCYVVGLVVTKATGYGSAVVHWSILGIFLVQVIYHVTHEPWKIALKTLSARDFESVDELENRVFGESREHGRQRGVVKTIRYGQALAAQVISVSLSPFISPAFLTVPLSFKAYGHVRQTLAVYVVLQLVFLQVLPLVTSLLMRSRGVVSDIHVRDKSKRHLVFAPTLFFAGLLIAVLLATRADTRIVLGDLSYLLVLSIVSAMTVRYKISAHAAAVAAVSAGLILVFGYSGLISMPFVGLVCWARMARRRHSAIEVVTGAILGYVVMFVVFGLHRLAESLPQLPS